MLRFVGRTQATVWVETGAACEVEVLGRRVRTFHVAGHHYGLVVLDGLEPGHAYEYEVRLDGERAWPEPGCGFPPSVLRTLDLGVAGSGGTRSGLRLVFGSCRTTAPHEPPWSLDRGERARGVDALRAYALRLTATPAAERPGLLLLVGDQVYADDASPGTRQFIRARRDPGRPPGLEVADFQEYARLYQEAWTDPAVRWLLSTVPSAMIFDDHDVHDDWNISASWVAEMRRLPWWEEKVTGALAAYWCYQHLGNLSPAALAADPVLARVRQAADAWPALRAAAREWDRERRGPGFSYAWDLGPARLVVVDSRCGRVLDGGRRELLGGEQWRLVDQQLRGGVDHLLVATSLPFLLAPGAHHLEAWSEAVCAGAWGAAMARVGERLRRGLDLEHWAAFGASFDRLAAALAEVGAGRRGAPPSSILLLSGDVHYAYLARCRFPAPAGVRSQVFQLVCSPFRNSLSARLRLATRLAMLRPVAWAWRLLARLAGVPAPAVRWRVLRGPRFENQVATLELDGGAAAVRIERAAAAGAGGGAPRLVPLIDHRLASAGTDTAPAAGRVACPP
jgi:hypothetical protein